MNTNKGSQAALSKLFANKNKNNITEIKRSIIYKVRQNVPKKFDNYSVCNLERMGIAEANRDKSMNTGN